MSVAECIISKWEGGVEEHTKGEGVSMLIAGLRKCAGNERMVDSLLIWKGNEE